MSIQHPRVKRKGQAIIMVALALSFMVSLAGISVDLVFAYAVKHYLGIAIDSVALSAMRGLSSGASYEEQANSITRISNLMLNSNFPAATYSARVSASPARQPCTDQGSPPARPQPPFLIRPWRPACVSCA